ncbi:nitrite reductase large subunit NirB [Paenibacillus tundrae]|uniref:nitrite reductase large subunit NirB n=1 Tax=Paenibacillus tundrae TaxID=528187 RepID=UPI0030CA7A04
MDKKKLVVIGNGMAGVKCIEEIIAIAPDTYDIVIYGNEPRPNYNRIMLSKVLQGEHTVQDIILNDWSWYDQHGIRLHTGETVTRINTQEKYVETASGMKESYDILILATGSSPFIPPIPGVDKERVMSFRTVDDCTRMAQYSKQYGKAAVIGGGLLGLEAARGLLHLGMDAVIVHNAPYIMNRQLDAQAADMLQRELESQGMKFLLSKNTQKIVGRSQAQGLAFTDGSRLEADVVIVAVGIRPNVELARRSGIYTHRAIVVDDFMRTSVQDVYAVGECAEHRGISYGLVAPLFEQGKVLARTLCRQETGAYAGSIPYSQLKVSGVDVFSAGDISGEGMQTAIQMLDGVQGTYKKVLMQAGKVRGAILFGDTTEGTALLSLVQRGADVAELRPHDGEPDPAEKAAAALPAQDTVCACNNVSKSAIMQAIQEHGLQNADQVKERTKASGSCGGCRPMVVALVKHTHNVQKNGGASTAADTEADQKELPICGCTTLGHDGLKSAMEEMYREQKSSVELTLDIQHGTDWESEKILLLQRLGWETASGCEVCEPAIRYYAQVLTHGVASMNSDREWGVYGAEQAHGTLVYSDDALYDALSRSDVDGLLTERLRLTWRGMAMPAPVRIAVATRLSSPLSPVVQDLGLQASPAGWEVYVGGHAEQPVKQGGLLGLAETVGDAVRLASACLQWYRQTARFDEPMWAWSERLGFMSIREILLDYQLQGELVNRKNAEIASASDARDAVLSYGRTAVQGQK